MAEDQPKHKPPSGMEPYDLRGPGDLGALSDDQQETLNKFKIKTRMENENYLRAHPEVDCLISGFLGEVLTKRPDNIREFAAVHFTNPEIATTLEKQLEDKQARMQQLNVLKKV